MEKLRWDLIKVLVADDDETTLKIFKKALRKLGCTGAFVLNGQEAVNMVKLYKFDICFMDLLMIELGGIDATIIIRGNYDQTLPIIGISNTLTETIKDKCLKIGMDDVLKKPIKMDLIQRMIEKYVTRDKSDMPNSGSFLK
jgi:CheY-like chemotaxis protein